MQGHIEKPQELQTCLGGIVSESDCLAGGG